VGSPHRNFPPSAASPRPWRRRLAAAAGLYAVVLVFATHYPNPEDFLGPSPPPDKLLHFGAYGLLGLLVTAAVLRARGPLGGRGLLAILVVLAAAAAIDEATQPAFGRAAEPLDWVFDCIGIVAGIAAAVMCSWAWERGIRRDSPS